MSTYYEIKCCTHQKRSPNNRCIKDPDDIKTLIDNRFDYIIALKLAEKDYCDFFITINQPEVIEFLNEHKYCDLVVIDEYGHEVENQKGKGI